MTIYMHHTNPFLTTKHTLTVQKLWQLLNINTTNIILYAQQKQNQFFLQTKASETNLLCPTEYLQINKIVHWKKHGQPEVYEQHLEFQKQFFVYELGNHTTKTLIPEKKNYKIKLNHITWHNEFLKRHSC